MPWSCQIEELHEGRVQRYRIQQGCQTMRWLEVLPAWQHQPGFRAYFAALLAQAPWPAFYWETPAVSTARIAGEFELVLVESRSLANVKAEPEAFREHFPGSQTSEPRDIGDCIAVFPNLGGDAVLVAPCPMGPIAGYAHLAAFCRQAPATQQHALWERVAVTMQQRLRRPEPVWLSTSGQGVSWLHVRLDDRPKYYNYPPYRQAPAA
ncbi:MAG: hypothetical protein WBN31_11465 [Gammaproteobacteria bacterium]